MEAIYYIRFATLNVNIMKSEDLNRIIDNDRAYKAIILGLQVSQLSHLKSLDDKANLFYHKNPDGKPLEELYLSLLSKHQQELTDKIEAFSIRLKIEGEDLGDVDISGFFS